MQSTFTVLVTVEHDPDAGHSQGRIAEAIQLALEEGTRETAPFLSANVDVFKGHHINVGQMTPTSAERYTRVRELHIAAA